MSARDSKKAKQETSSELEILTESDSNTATRSAPLCPLLAKDSEWMDILLSAQPEPGKSTSNVSGDEETLQVVESEDGPLAIMFPGLLEKDPQTLQGVLDKAMSTTEVTKHLVELGEKANFTFMKKADRLIPQDKRWLESVLENCDSHCSLESGLFGSAISSDYDADNEFSDKQNNIRNKFKRKKWSRSLEANAQIESEASLLPAPLHPKKLGN